MPSTESERFELHRELKNQLGDVVADALMNMFPQEGWADFARTRDIDRVLAETTARFDQFEARIEERFTNFDARIDAKFEHFEARTEIGRAHV